VRRALIVLPFLVAALTVGVIAHAQASSSVTTISAGPIAAVKVRTGTGPLDVGSITTPSYSWIDIPGASVSMVIPSTQHGVFLARLSAQPMRPDDGLVDQAGGNDGADLFASVNDAFAPYQKYLRSMMRASGPYPAGTYTIKAQALLAPPGQQQGTQLELRDWTFQVERAVA
jgi:hypothetical protein